MPTLTPAPDLVALGWKSYPDDDGYHTVVGDLWRLPEIHSPRLGNHRDLLVYLPPSYHTEPDRRYPVVYMHDGQNLFDDATAFAGEWQVDNTMDALAVTGREAIVVGVPNTGIDRIHEYSPVKDQQERGGRGETYVAFLTETVKPRIDADFRTCTGPLDTIVAGSSMGGLISLYAFLKRPDVFGHAGVMSPSLWFADRAIFPIVRETPKHEGRIYLDVGTKEGAQTVADVRRLRELILSKGYRRHHDFCYVEDQGAGHSEIAWRDRLHFAMDFLLGPAE
ncbi:MAG: alpha/beta hydrolase-fold protein [Bacteroidota bacterium]